jgi:hypothetical protein
VTKEGLGSWRAIAPIMMMMMMMIMMMIWKVEAFMYINITAV